MNCRAFRASHLDLTDGTLSLPDRAAAQAHLEGCTACARFDAVVRRSLLLARNLPPVMPSADFRQRLTLRLSRERASGRLGGATRRNGRQHLAAVVSLAFAAGMAIAVITRSHSGAPAVDPHRAAPLASVSSDGAAHWVMMRPDFLAGASAGIPLWSAAALIDEAPVRFANQHLTLPTRRR